MDKRLWIETDYFKDFKCKCGDCKRCCCNGWQIGISKKEYYKLLTLECSQKLADKIESAFVVPQYPSEEEYRIIAPNYLGNCPMLDEDGLCMIHKELGPEALAQVCRSYPRSMKQVNNVLQANCSNSCEAVVELLLKKDRVNFVTSEKYEKPNITKTINDDLSALSLMFTQIIQDRSLPLNERIKRIVNYLNSETKNDTNSLDAFLQVANFIKTVSINSDIYDNFINVLSNNYSLDQNGLNKYKEDERQFEINYPNWMIYFENVIVNHLYYLNIPYVDERISREDCTEGLCLLYAIMKIICSLMCKEDHSIDNLAYIISDIFHLVEHSPFYYNAHLLIKNETTLLNI